MKNIYLTLLLVLILFQGFARNKYLPKSSGELIHHTYYSLCYDEEAEQALWVYYQLTPSMVSGAVKRTDNFREDKKVSTASAQLDDYKGSPYDRGHLCPAASMSHNSVAMSESFYMSNMSPQDPSLNRGRWKSLEELVRAWVVVDSLLYVVSGPVLGGDMKVIGANKVAVPNHYYKLIYSPNHNKMIAFLMPNKSLANPVASYAVTVDEIEELTKIDFFSALSDDVEHKLESSLDTSAWNFSATQPKQKTAKTTKSSTQQCKGVTKAGSRCANNTNNANGYCHHHQSQDTKKRGD